MLERLGEGSASISDLAKPCGMSLTGMKKHIRVLEEAQLVATEKVGRVRTCRLERGPMRALELWIAEHRAIWERRLDLLGDVLDDAFPDHERTSQQ